MFTFEETHIGVYVEQIHFASGTNHPRVVSVYKVQRGNSDPILKYIY